MKITDILNYIDERHCLLKYKWKRQHEKNGPMKQTKEAHQLSAKLRELQTIRQLIHSREIVKVTNDLKNNRLAHEETTGKKWMSTKKFEELKFETLGEPERKILLTALEFDINKLNCFYCEEKIDYKTCGIFPSLCHELNALLLCESILCLHRYIEEAEEE